MFNVLIHLLYIDRIGFKISYFVFKFFIFCSLFSSFILDLKFKIFQVSIFFLFSVGLLAIPLCFTEFLMVALRMWFLKFGVGLLGFSRPFQGATNQNYFPKHCMPLLFPYIHISSVKWNIRDFANVKPVPLLPNFFSFGK